MSGFDYKEFLHILIGVPPEFKIGEITSVTHEVMCFAGSSLEQVTSPDDDVRVFDVSGKDVTNYAWWANPGKYTIKIISYSLCPSIGSDKAPSSLSYVATPLPPENILTYDYDTLKAALNDGRPLLLSAENKTFSARSEPHAVSVVNLRLTNLNAPSGIETDPELFQKHAPAGISTFQFSVDNAPTGIISNELLGQNSSPTGIQEYEGLTNVHSPTGLIAYTASSVQPHNAKVFNLDFSRHPNALPTTADVIDLELKVGPQAISATPSLKIDSAPVGLSSVVSPSSLSSVNGLGTLVDMDGDGYYVGVDMDDNDPSITIHLQAQHAPTSIGVEEVSPSAVSTPSVLKATAPPNVNSGPTNLEALDPPPLSNEAPTGISYLVDADEDGFYPPVDLDDNDFNVRDGTQDVDSDGLNWLYDIDPANKYSAGVKIPGFGVWMPEGAMNQGGILSTMTPSKGFFTGSYNRENSTSSTISKVAPGSSEMQALESAHPTLNFEEGIVYERVLDQNYNPVRWLDKHATTATTPNFDEDFQNCRYLVKGFITNPSGAKGYDEWNAFGVTNKVVWFFTDSLTAAPQGGGLGANWIKSPYAVAHGNSDGLAGRFPKDLEFKMPETSGEVVIGDSVPNKLCKYSIRVPTEYYHISSTSWLSRTNMVADMQEFEPVGAPLSFKHILDKCLVYSMHMSSKIGPGIMYNADPYRVVPWHNSQGNGGTIYYYCENDVVFTDGTTYSKNTNFTYWSSTMTKQIASWTPINAGSQYTIGTLYLDTRY